MSAFVFAWPAIPQPPTASAAKQAMKRSRSPALLASVPDLKARKGLHTQQMLTIVQVAQKESSYARGFCRAL
jgi:hypothetical protein